EDRAVLGVQLDDGGCHRHGLQRDGGFGDDGRGVVLRHLLVLLGDRRDDAVVEVDPVGGGGDGMRLQPALVAAQPLLDTLGGGVEGELRILGLAGGLQRDAGVEMHDAIGAEARARLLDRHRPGIAAVEILADGLADASLDLGAESVADLHVLTGNAQAHVKLTFSCPGSLSRIPTDASLYLWSAHSRFTAAPASASGYANRQPRPRGAA